MGNAEYSEVKDTNVVSPSDVTSQDQPNYDLPDIEEVSAFVHAAWMEGKKAQGVNSRKAEDGEELMVPYEQLSEKQKDQDRNTVKTVYAAINQLSI